jgi:tetratricopeptide (TPR) repeat protein
VSVCQALLEEMNENPAAALKSYQRAFDQGERDPQVVRRLIYLLHANGRYSEADVVIGKLPENMLLTGDLQRAIIDISLKTGHNDRAFALAEKAVQADSKDYRDYLLYTQALPTDEENQAKAESALRRAIELAGNAPEMWILYIQHLARMGKKEKAEAALTEAQGKLPKDQVLLTLAECNEVLGRMDQALKLYQEAVKARPNDAAVLHGISEYYVRINRIKDAEPYLQKIIALNPSGQDSQKIKREIHWAKRTLGVIWATAGSYQQKLKALELIEDQPQEASHTGSVEDQRARAVVLAAQSNRANRQQAITILEELSRHQATAEDEVVLIQLYEAAGNWPKAHEKVLSLLAMPSLRPLQAGYAARRLLVHDRVGEAEVFINKLKDLVPKEKPDPYTFLLLEMEARLRMAQGKGDEAVAALKKYVEGKDENAFRAVATLLDELGKPEAAEGMYRKYVAVAKQPERVLPLAQFLARHKRQEEALKICDSAWQTCRPEAVAEASTAVLYAGPYQPQLAHQVEQRVAEALQKNPKNPTLVLTLASVRTLQGRYTEAESLYRQVLQLDRRNMIALNNLAWLLVLQSEKSAAEALDLINLAVENAGPVPGLLDTRGVIHLKLGQASLAIPDLEESIYAAPSASKYFHLAQACLTDVNRKRDAVAALEKAQALVRKGETLDPLEQKAYDQLTGELLPQKAK